MNKWLNEIKKYPRLNLENARNLYLKILDTDNIDEKKCLRDELIKSTLYVVISYVKNNNLDVLCGSVYDIDDIVSTSIEFFIKEIDAGVLLKINTYAHIFSSRYFTYLSNYLIPTTNIDDLYPSNILNEEDFKEYFYIYLKLKKENLKVSYENFLNEVEIRSKTINFKHKVLTVHDLDSIFIIFERICNHMNIEEDNEKIISRRILSFIRYLLFANTLSMPIPNEYKDKKNYEDDVINKMLYKEMYNIYFSQLTENQKNVLDLHYGLFGPSQSINSIASKSNRSNECIRTIEKYAFKKYTNNDHFANFAKETIK